MTAVRSIPSTVGAVVTELAPLDGYVVLTADLREQMTREWGRMVPLFDTYAASVDYADERFAYNEVGYAVCFDPDSATFVAFTSRQDTEFILTESDALFDAIRDEAASHGETVTDTEDGVITVDNGSSTRVAVRVAR